MIAQVALALPFADSYDYLIPAGQTPVPGQRCLVPFGPRRLWGVVTGVKETSDVPHGKLKPLLALAEGQPLWSSQQQELFAWISRYYQCSLGQIYEAALPAGLEPKAKEVLRLKPNAAKGLALAELAACQALEGKDPHKTKGWQELAAMEAVWQVECPDFLSEEWITLAQPPTKPFRTGSRNANLLGWFYQRPTWPLGLLRAQAGKDFAAATPLCRTGVLVKERRRPPCPAKEVLHNAFLQLNPHQQTAYEAVEASLQTRTFQTFLLFGVTGSGKTEVYLHAARRTLELGRRVLILLPEIALTPKAVARFSARFGSRIALLHSGLGETERAREWQRIQTGQADVVIGARSALFAPLSDLGLIVVDEEHDPSYKQNETPYYQARDLAVKWGQDQAATVVLGSATPSIETFYNAQRGKYHLLCLENRALGQEMPQVHLINLKEAPRQLGVFYLSVQLVEEIKEILAQGRQGLIFLNRRGFAALLTCKQCGVPVLCDHCSLALTWHQSGRALICHSCGARKFYPKTCKDCGFTHFDKQGIGTQRVEQDLQRLFPQARFLRLDRDALSRKGELARLMELIQEQKVDLVVGTQLISKGHDFPGVGLVAVLMADMSLNIPDTRASERSFQLFSQVAGRSGRGLEAGQAWVQTYNPEHRVLQAALTHDYPAFYASELEQRQILGLPPFGRWILLRLSHGDEIKLRQEAERLKLLLTELGPGFRLLGPKEAPHYKVADRYHLQLAMTGPDLAPAKARLHWLLWDKAFHSPIRVTLDVDPYSL